MNTRGENLSAHEERIADIPDHTADDGPDSNGALAAALRGLAVGRVLLGAAAIAAPNTLTRAYGTQPSPELRYMVQIFGARAIALGLGYLTAPPSDRRRWQRLALMVDVLDTVHGTARLTRGDIPRPAALALTALTGTYMTIGATRLARDLSEER